MLTWKIALAAIVLSAGTMPMIVHNRANTVERGAVQPRTAGVVSSQQTPTAEKSPDVSKAEFGWGPVRATDW
jgi:hypothetical protein